MTLEEFVGKLDTVQRAARGYMACCPAHDSQSRESLSVSAGDDGRILVKLRRMYGRADRPRARPQTEGPFPWCSTVRLAV
jgi:hypothetical protein